jgi:hypothetical protein
MSVEIQPETVDFFNADNSRAASWQINRLGTNEWSKMYFERVSANNPAQVEEGDIWTGSSFYRADIYLPAVKQFLDVC